MIETDWPSIEASLDLCNTNKLWGLMGRKLTESSEWPIIASHPVFSLSERDIRVSSKL